MSRVCANHPQQRAVYRCRECGGYLCPACITSRDIGETNVTSCILCKGTAEMLPPDELPLSAFASRILKAPFNRHSAVTLAGGAVVCALVATAAHYNILPLINLIAAGLLWGIFAAFVCLVINRTANGKFDVPMVGDVSDLWDDMLMPGLRLLAAYLTIGIPLLVYLMFFKSWNLPSGPTQEAIASNLIDPLVLVFLLIGVFYMPMATIVAAIEGSFFAVLNPVLVLALIFRAFGGYMLALVVFFGVLVAGGVVSAIVTLLLSLFGNQFFLESLVSWYLTFLTWYLAASVLGSLAYTYGDRYGLAPTQRKPHPADLPAVLRPAGAAGVAPPPEASEFQTADPVRRAPIELPDEPEVELLAPAGPGMPVEIAAAAAIDPVREPTPPDPTALVADGDLDGACGAYLALVEADSRAAIPPDTLLAVAGQLEALGQHHEAVTAYRKVGALFPNHPKAPAVLLKAAFITHRKLGRPEDAKLILDFLIKRFPNSPAAAEARKVAPALV